LQDSLTAIMAYRDKHIMQVVHLEEKITQLDSWIEDSLTHMMAQLQQNLVEKEEVLENLQEYV
jgi:hypothetical protein